MDRSLDQREVDKRDIKYALRTVEEAVSEHTEANSEGRLAIALSGHDSYSAFVGELAAALVAKWK